MSGIAIEYDNNNNNGDGGDEIYSNDYENNNWLQLW